MIRELWSRVVRLLSGEMDEHVLTEEILWKARRPSTYTLSDKEWEHLKRQPFFAPLHIGAFGKAMADLGQTIRALSLAWPTKQSPRQ